MQSNPAVSIISKLQLLDGVTATGAWFIWPATEGLFSVYCAGFNGATVRLEVKAADNSTGIPVDPTGTTNVTFTTLGGVGGFTLAPGMLIRAGVINATPSSPVFAQAIAIPS